MGWQLQSWEYCHESWDSSAWSTFFLETTWSFGLEVEISVSFLLNRRWIDTWLGKQIALALMRMSWPHFWFLYALFDSRARDDLHLSIQTRQSSLIPAPSSCYGKVDSTKRYQTTPSTNHLDLLYRSALLLQIGFFFAWHRIECDFPMYCEVRSRMVPGVNQSSLPALYVTLAFFRGFGKTLVSVHSSKSICPRCPSKRPLDSPILFSYNRMREALLRTYLLLGRKVWHHSAATLVFYSKFVGCDCRCLHSSPRLISVFKAWTILNRHLVIWNHDKTRILPVPL